MKRPYQSIISLNAGMVLMFLGFFMYLGGKPEIISGGIMVSGAACEFLGFFLAYLAYKTAI